MSTVENPRAGLKTWSALMGTRKRPSEYEVVSYKLLYRTRDEKQPYEQAPSLMMNEWYRDKVFNSPLQHPDWDSFRDPDELTYRAYCTMQDGQEEYVDGLLNAHSDNGHDKKLDSAWVGDLARLYTPARYVMGAAKMASAYVVQMAPASTISNCAAFQEADCYRWLSRIAYRTRELSKTYSDHQFGDGERGHWEGASEWQGYRELFEKVLATYDWGESFVALNVMALPALDFGFVQGLKAAAYEKGDTLTALLCDNQARDGARSMRWTTATVKLALENEPNKAVLTDWTSKWAPLAEQAVTRYCAGLPSGDAIKDEALEKLHSFWKNCGLEITKPH